MDLRLTAVPEGYRQVFVVKRDGAGSEFLKTHDLDFEWSGQGTRLIRDHHGGIQILDTDGNIALSAPAPLTWNSDTDPEGTPSSASMTLGSAGASGASTVVETEPEPGVDDGSRRHRSGWRLGLARTPRSCQSRFRAPFSR